MIGKKIHDLCFRLFKINRSITGDGVRQTLTILQEFMPELSISEVPTGTTVFDWTIPKEWKVNDAYIMTPGGKKICSFKDNNLHLVGYSTPIHAKLNLSELQNNLYSLPDQPTQVMLKPAKTLDLSLLIFLLK